MNTVQTQAQKLFDDVYVRLSKDQVMQGMQELFNGLRQLRRGAASADWLDFARKAWTAHPVKQLLHQDPFTRRAFEKPRGYAGDAELLDYIYGLRSLPTETSRLGAAIFEYMFQVPACRAVRARRDILAARVDRLAEQLDNPRILAIACGHLREAQQSAAVREGRVGDYVGLDQDVQSLAVVQSEQSAHGVRAAHGSVKSILKGESVFADFDFVYSTGLYDYLPQPVAIELTTRLFGFLNPGGRLLVANFLPDVPDVGYMETFMGWPLIYRNRAELIDVASGLPKSEVASVGDFCDPHDNVVFLEVEKRK